MTAYDCIVIGGGPGGYTAAVEAGRLGMKTALVEKENLGGTCLNWGCVPTKALLRNAEVLHLLQKGRTFGFSMDNLSVDYSAAYRRSRSIVNRQIKRLAVLMKNKGIDVYAGTGWFRNSNTIEIATSGERLQGKQVVIATGAKPRGLAGANDHDDNILDHRAALSLQQIPSSALIVGAGPIGMEFATIWNRYGCKVTVAELADRPLPLEDADISNEAMKQFQRCGIDILTSTRVEELVSDKDGVSARLECSGTSRRLEVRTVLVAIGFMANSASLGLNGIGVACTNGAIEIDDAMRTNVPHIYAIGDVTGKLCLAHTASAQAMIAARAMAGRQTAPLDYTAIPRCTFTAPEVASVGLTERQAADKGHAVATARSPFIANGKAMAMDDASGFVKLVSDAGTRKLLGAHLIGGHVTELVAGPTGMIALAGETHDLGRTIHPHPTLSEALMEAAHVMCGHAVHS